MNDQLTNEMIREMSIMFGGGFILLFITGFGAGLFSQRVIQIGWSLLHLTIIRKTARRKS
jgi:hypothetical protein